MQKFFEEKREKKLNYPEEERSFEKHIFPHHFSYEEFKKFPKKLKVQIIYSMFDILHENCGEALEKLFPQLFALKDKRYDIYASILFSERNEEEPCLARFLKELRKHSKKKFHINKQKLKKVISYLKKNEVKSIDELYPVLPREVFHKLKHFDRLRKDMSFESERESWIWFLEKEIELSELSRD